jgi:hypothetical protein
MLLVHPSNQFLRRYAGIAGAYHDGRTVGVIGAKVQALVAAGFLKADPDIGL